MKKNHYLLGAILLIIVLLVYSGYKGGNQIEQRKEDYSAYLEIMQSIQKKDELDGIISKIEKIEESYGKSDTLILAKIEAYSAWDKTKEAQEAFEELFILNKSLLNNSNLLVLYAEIVNKNGQQDEAKNIIAYASEIGISDGFSERAQGILK